MVMTNLRFTAFKPIYSYLFQIFLFGVLACANAGADVYSTRQGPIRVNETTVFVDTGNVSRKHDFGPTGSFFDPISGASTLATIISGDIDNRNILLSGSGITQRGFANRVEWTPGAVVLTNRMGDGKAGEPCRVQAASYPIAPDLPLIWTLRVQMGEKKSGNSWPLLPSGKDPVLLWQVKAPNLQPSLAMVVDTDTLDPSRLMVYFSVLSGSSQKISRASTVHGLSPDVPIDVRIEAVLDEKDLAAGGKGKLRVWVNEQLSLDRMGPTLTQNAREPHQWFFGMYRYLSNCPSNLTRLTRWEKVLLENGNVQPGANQ